MSNKKIEKEIIAKLKKYEKDRDNIVCMIYQLREAQNYEMALIKFGIYLDDPSTSKTRNDLHIQTEKISSST